MRVEELRGRIVELIRNRGALSFDELRAGLEEQGVYIDGKVLRGVVADLLREGILYKEPSASRRKMLLKLSRST